MWFLNSWASNYGHKLFQMLLQYWKLYENGLKSGKSFSRITWRDRGHPIGIWCQTIDSCNNSAVIIDNWSLNSNLTLIAFYQSIVEFQSIALNPPIANNPKSLVTSKILEFYNILCKNSLNFQMMSLKLWEYSIRYSTNLLWKF